MGWRGRGRSGPWPGAGPFSNLPPWQRPGWLYGYGRGLGYGRGFGYGYWGAQYNPYVCQRFPWLTRWWWAYPHARQYSATYPQGYYGYPPTYTAAPTPEAELEMLDSYMEQIKVEQESISRRIEELKKMIEEGTSPRATSPAGQIPFWEQMPYGPAPTPEQEKQMLEQQSEWLKRQIDDINKRLEELRSGE